MSFSPPASSKSNFTWLRSSSPASQWTILRSPLPAWSRPAVHHGGCQRHRTRCHPPATIQLLHGLRLPKLQRSRHLWRRGTFSGTPGERRSLTIPSPSHSGLTTTRRQPVWSSRQLEVYLDAKRCIFWTIFKGFNALFDALGGFQRNWMFSKVLGIFL